MTDGINGIKELIILSILLVILEHKINIVFLYRKIIIKILRKQQANMFNLPKILMQYIHPGQSAAGLFVEFETAFTFIMCLGFLRS